MTAARLAIGAFGLALLGYAAVLELTTVASAQYPAVMWWVFAAIVVHDGLIAPVVVAFGVIGRGTARRIGPIAAAVAGIALTALGPFCPMPAAICGWLGLSRCDGALMDLELELPHVPRPSPPSMPLARGVWL